MVADFLTLRATREHARAAATRETVEDAVERIRRAADRIRRMNALYRERLDGRRDE